MSVCNFLGWQLPNVSDMEWQFCISLCILNSDEKHEMNYFFQRIFSSCIQSVELFRQGVANTRGCIFVF